MQTPVARLASLDLVRSFVAVARRMSVTQAAHDLCLTQSAVSRQIQGLEESLGVALFNRGYRTISLTPAGEQLFRVADGAVQQLQEVLNALVLTQNRLHTPVTITASVGFVSLWLLPRLGAFKARHPDIDVRLAADNRLMDLKMEGIDLGIRYCTARNAPEGAVRLFGEVIVPVGHPALAARGLDMAALIKDQVLLEYDDPRRPWLQWSERLKAKGLGAVKPKGIVHFNQYDQAIHAALAGQGIALGRMVLVEPMLAAGRLAVLCDDRHEQPGGYGYWLIQADDNPRADVVAAADWIREAAAATGL